MTRWIRVGLQLIVAILCLQTHEATASIVLKADLVPFRSPGITMVMNVFTIPDQVAVANDPTTDLLILFDDMMHVEMIGPIITTNDQDLEIDGRGLFSDADRNNLGLRTSIGIVLTDMNGTPLPGTDGRHGVSRASGPNELVPQHFIPSTPRGTIYHGLLLTDYFVEPQTSVVFTSGSTPVGYSLDSNDYQVIGVWTPQIPEPFTFGIWSVLGFVGLSLRPRRRKAG